MSHRQPLETEEAFRLISLILKEGMFELSIHAKRQMSRRGASNQDVVRALQTGRILKKPEWDEEHEHWKYRVEGVDLDGDELRVITVIFDSEMTLLVVTVF